MTFFNDRLLELAGTHVWQLTLVTGAVFVLSLFVKKRHPHLIYLLWMLVLLKAVTPPVWQSPTSVFGSLFSREAPSSSGTIVREFANSTEASVEPSAVVRSTTSGSALPSAALPGISRSELLVMLWASSSAGLFAFLILRHCRHCRELTRDALANDRLQALTERLARTLGLKRTPRLILSSAECGPSAFGLFRPHLFLPRSSSQTTGIAELEPVIAHELIHLRRRDPLAAWFQLVAVCLNWWNPLVWWSSRCATRVREDCCDQEVLGSFLFPPERYAQALIHVLRRKLRTAPLCIAALPLTQDRIRNIMKRDQSFAARCPRWCWIVTVLLAIGILPGDSPAEINPDSASIPTIAVSAQAEPEREGDSPSSDPAVKVPQLMYLAWSQAKPKEKNSISRFLWTPRGRVLSEGEVSETIADRLPASTREQEGYPQLECLNLFFDVDGRLKNCPVFPTVLAEGKRGNRWTAFNSEKGWACSSISLEKKDFAKWPAKMSLEIKYPLEDRTVIKTLDELPDGDLEIAEGVVWYLDASRAVKHDSATNRWIPIKGKTAAVLQIRRGRPDKLTDYAVQVYLKDEKKPLDENFSTLIEPDGQLHEIEVSNPVDPQQIERIEVLRQRHDVRLIRDIPIKVDLIPKPK